MSIHWTSLFRRYVLFQELEAEQASLIARVIAYPEEGYLLISEPTPTFSHGRFADSKDLLWTEAELKTHEVTTVQVSRGGKWTYHGPGQILVYPIVGVGQLGYERRAIHRLMNDLRQCLREVLTTLNVNAVPRDRPFGLFVGDAKIASFGMSVTGGIASHGLALYLEDQSAYFRGIHPCGKPNEPVTSLRKEGVSLSWDEVALLLSESIKKGFKRS